MPAIIFDFDGTLCDSLQESVVVLNKLAEVYGFNQVHPEAYDELRAMNSRQLLKRLGIPLSKLPFVIRKGRQMLHSRMAELKPIPGIREMLTQLKSRSLTLGILTSNSKANVEEFLSRNNLNVFDFIYSGSSIFGKAKLLKKLFRDLSLNPQAAIYVGDETRDIEAAKASLSRVIAVSWGLNSDSALSDEKPDFLIHNPSELTEIVSKLRTV